MAERISKPDGYFYVPDAIFKCGLSKTAMLVYFCLCKMSDSSGNCYPSVEYIGDLCNIKSKSTVRRALKDLIDHHLLIKQQQFRKNGGYSSNLYQIKSDTPKDKN